MSTAWADVADAYAISFATLCAGTVDRLLDDAGPGTVLDAGSGTGVFVARAQKRGQDVVAVDPDPGMAARSGRAVPGRVVRSALPRLALRDGDVAASVANFVVNHVPDPWAAVRELARVTSPGGRVLTTSWTAAAPAWGELVGGALAAAGAEAPPATRLAPELDFERSPAGLAGLAEAAGLRPLTVTELRWTWTVRADDLWRGVSGGVAGAGRTYLAQPAEVRLAADRCFREAAGRLATDGLLRLPAVAAYVVARA